MNKMFKIVFSVCLFCLMHLYGDLKEPLEENFGDAHFEFVGNDYAFRMDTQGRFIITSKGGSIDRKKLEACYFQYVSKSISQNNLKEYDIVELKTEHKISASSFTLIVKGVMNHGVVFASKIQGSKNKMIISTEMDKLDPKSYFRIRFSIPKAKDDHQNGILARKVGKDLKTHPCGELYDVKNYESNCQAIVIKNRLAHNVVFEIEKSVGYLGALQHSHHVGSNLNEEFSVVYVNNQTKWVASKNTFSIQF